MDLGDCFTYTGEGGRELRGTKAQPKNLRTAPQSKDQTLTRGNLALSLNIESRKPVRVIRGSNLQNEFAPDFGYRYDGKYIHRTERTKKETILIEELQLFLIRSILPGLYTVEKYWSCLGKAGFKVYKFALRRCADQDPPPWIPNPYDSMTATTTEEPDDSESANKENCDDTNNKPPTSVTSTDAD